MTSAAARMSSATSSSRTRFFPKSDAAVLSSEHGQPPKRPQVVGPVLDPANLDVPVVPCSPGTHDALYPSPVQQYDPAPVPEKPPTCASQKYLRAFMHKNERLRLSMLWYYTRDILDEEEFLRGLQEKVHMAKESTEWDYAIIGILDVNYYIRLATIGVALGTLPRGETLCAHTVTQPPNSVFLLPNMMEDWRFRDSPYVESGGLRAYAGAPLRVQNESGDVVALGTLCVASPRAQEPLTKNQQQTITQLADWVVSDIVKCARARRQRERRRMMELLSVAQKELEDDAAGETPVLRILKAMYPEASLSLKPTKPGRLKVEGRDPINLCDFEDGLWEDRDYIDYFIAHSNQRKLPDDRVVRVIAAPCERMSGQSILAVASRDFRLVFDDVDMWFIQSCATIITQMWHKRLLDEVMRAKEKFLRGVSHQLRTLIHGILSSVDLLAEELKSTKAIMEAATSAVASAANSGAMSIYLDTIKTSGRDLIKIVNSMITLSRWADIAMTERSYGTRTISDLEADLVGDVQGAVYGDVRLRTSLCVHHKVPSDCDSIRTDQSLLRDSLLPLLMNAIQHTPKGTVRVTITLCSEDQKLVVDIEDNGCGIRPEDHERVFEPYEKAVDHSTGAGLGLTLASKFASLLNGSVRLVSSAPGRGSHFQATFREVESVRSGLPTTPLQATQLSHLPPTFHRMALDNGPISLCEHFSACLLDREFIPTSEEAATRDSFALVDFVADPDERRAYLSRVPSETVAICLIPASEVDTPLEPNPKNVVYVNGPFLTATVSSALIEADKLSVAIKASMGLLSPHQVPLPESDDAELLEGDVTPAPNVSHVNELVSRGRKDRDPLTGETINSLVTPSAAAAAAAQTRAAAMTTVVEPRIVIPMINTLPGRAKPTALIVDDNEINLRVLQMYCRKRGMPAVCATDGAKAVQLFIKYQTLAAGGSGGAATDPEENRVEQQPAIQLILMDLQMPLCDGIEATRQIRALEKQHDWPRSSLFIVTGQDNPADRTAAHSVGADEYLVKPVGVRVLDREVKRYFPAFTH